jgi:uncharacterized OB-fold protein
MKKETLDLLKLRKWYLDSLMSYNGEPYFNKEYIEKTFLGIKTCKNCGVKDFDFEDYCKSCERNDKINELLQ